MKYKLDIKKKLREKQLIEEFVRICPEYQDYSFDSFTENPDVIYKSKNGHFNVPKFPEIVKIIKDL